MCRNTSVHIKPYAPSAKENNTVHARHGGDTFYTMGTRHRGGCKYKIAGGSPIARECQTLSRYIYIVPRDRVSNAHHITQKQKCKRQGHLDTQESDCARVECRAVGCRHSRPTLDTQVDCVRRVSLSPSLPQVTPHGSRVSYTDSRVRDSLGSVRRVCPPDAHGHHVLQPAVEQRRLAREGVVSDAQ